MSNVDPLTNHGTLLFTEAVNKDLSRQVSLSFATPSLKGGEWCGLQKHRPFPCSFKNEFDKPLSTACHVFDSAEAPAARKSSKHSRVHRQSFRRPYPFTAAPASLDALQTTLDHLREAEKASIAGCVEKEPEPRLNQGELDRRPTWNRELRVQYFSFPCCVPCRFGVLVMHIFRTLYFTYIQISLIYCETQEYPEGYGPGDALPGTAAEFYRYRSVFVRGPNDADRTESLLRSRSVLCAVCEAILGNLLQSTNFRDEDALLDALEGLPHPQERPAADPQVERIRQGKRGCQRHFKDSLMAHGWRLTRCATERPQHCLVQGSPRDLDDLDTYTLDNEALYYACEQTVGAHLDDLAEFFINTGKDKFRDNVKTACRRVARCDKTAATASGEL